MAGERTVRVKVGPSADYDRDVELTFQRLKLLCERGFDPYVILAEQRLRPSPTLGLDTTKAVDILRLVTGDKPDTFWELAVKLKPITVIDAAADVLIAFATAGAQSGRADTAQDDDPAGTQPPKG